MDPLSFCVGVICGVFVSVLAGWIFLACASDMMSGAGK